MTAINRAMQLEYWCRYNQGVWLDADMRTESRFDVLLTMLSSLEEAGLNPGTNETTVADFADWFDSACEESQSMALEELWACCDEIVAAVGFTVTVHPDDGACLGLWPVESIEGACHDC